MPSSQTGELNTYPALDVRGQFDLVIAMADDFRATAVEERGDIIRVFFGITADRDGARAAIEPHFPVAPIDVPDEDWARRSQEGLQPVTIGRLTIVPDPQSSNSDVQSAVRVVIRPSMGFGTGHHASTRLCLEALLALDVTGKRVLDVGTGSGVLAIVASRLGASRALGIDSDEDAIRAARENLAYNSEATNLSFAVADVSTMQGAVQRLLGQADIVTANLTGALLVRSAGCLLGATACDGVLVISGVQIPERDQVVAAFAPSQVISERGADEWVALVMKRA